MLAARDGGSDDVGGGDGRVVVGGVGIRTSSMMPENMERVMRELAIPPRPKPGPRNPSARAADDSRRMETMDERMVQLGP